MKRPAIKVKIHRLSILILVRVGGAILIWTAINGGVPRLRRVSVLGSLMWKWSLLAALILLSYPLLITLYLTVALLIRHGYHVVSERFRGSFVRYCMEGLDKSMVLVAYFTCVLVTWLLCIDTTITPLHRYGALTLASFLVGAVLNVVKRVVLLWWKTKLIYRKYEGEILSAGCQLYFHLLVMDQDHIMRLVDWWDWANYTPQPFTVPKTTSQSHEGKGKTNNGRRGKKRPIEDYMLKKHVRLMHIHHVATCLTKNFELSLTEDDDIPDIVPILQRKFPSDQRSGFRIEATVYEKTCMDRDDAQLLLELLQIETSKKTPTYEDFEKWMADGFKNCYAAGNKINGAMEVKRILDRVLTGLIAFVVFIFWLFITGLASTKVVIGLGSIFVGLTFMFGDTCKSFFQGVIFSFVTHPFDVADRCIIDNKELRVKKINILTTSFLRSQTKETVMYPNSYLATQQIVILPGEPRRLELEDVIELNLPCFTKALHIKLLEKKIQGYIEDGIQSGHYKKHYRISLKEIGGSIKMVVHFRHNLNEGDESEQLEAPEIRKDRQRSELLLQLREFQEDVIGNQVPPPYCMFA